MSSRRSNRRRASGFGSALEGAGRLRDVISVFVRYGFPSLAERLNLGRFVIERISSIDVQELSDAERLRLAFEELGPTFVKLGQQIASRPDLVPEEICQEFKKLQDQVAPLPFEAIRTELETHFQKPLAEVFERIEEAPLGSASIAQVHSAVLRDGREVVVKVQRPGVALTIRRDLAILRFLAERMEKFIPELAAFNPVGVVETFTHVLALETDFTIEANNIRRFAENFRSDSRVKIPDVHWSHTGARVLVMEKLAGRTLSAFNGAASAEERDRLLRTILHCYFRQVFIHGLFHGDMHPGNIIVMDGGRIGLIDFGMVGRMNRRVRDGVASMFVALHREDYERLAMEYIDIARQAESVDIDGFASDLQDTIAPQFGMTLKEANLGKLLISTTTLASQHELVLSNDLVLFFKSLVAVEGVARLINPTFDLLGCGLEFAGEISESRASSGALTDELITFGVDSAHVLRSLPRQMRQILRRLSNPETSIRLSLNEAESLAQALEQASKRIYWALLMAATIIGFAIYMSHRVSEHRVSDPSAPAAQSSTM